jgi:two-component system, NtrC family, sensor histidine kinase HydH
MFQRTNRPGMAPPGHHEIQREEFARLFGHMVGIRLFVVPVFAGTVLWLVWDDPSAWRRPALLGLGAGLLAFFVVEFVRFRRRGFTPGAVPLNLAAAVLGQLSVAAASGGLGSPVIYVAVPLGLVAGVFIRSPWNWVVTAFQVTVIWTLAVLGATGAADLNPAVFGGGSRVGGPPMYLYLHAFFLSAAVILGAGGGRFIRSAFEATIRRALAAQHESLRAHAERAEELTALSGEIAHELKNPLASVKGLGGLLAQHLPDGKGAERLSVLRHEVDRMGSILDEFLNFSRPLVPLALGETDVAALCHEVAALHEGMARERGVEVTARAGGVAVRCDPRKVKQVLINLVQNALDASPSGAAVALEAEATAGGGARVRVLDRGRGIDPALGDAVFAPGVTSKPQGSGFGLTIARSLARQHGGDLALAARAGGGTVAELVLPAKPAEAGGGRAA